MTDRTYKRALELLDKSRRQSRPRFSSEYGIASLTRMPSVKGESDLKGTPSIVGMRPWLDQMGHSPADIARLNPIHVAGTKGKGSTCAFIESFLRAHGQRTGFPKKTGLYTSPHLMFPEERIRLNFMPISQDLFTKYFFEVHDALSEPYSEGFDQKPRYLQLCALVAFHAFIRERVDVAVFETHHGGEYDSTNVIEKPVVTTVTSLGMDHVLQLGPSIENIAWHKAGIFKPGAHAFSAPQGPEAAEVLRNRASEKGVPIQFTDRDPSLPPDSPQLEPDIQRVNASLGLAVARSFLEQKAPSGISEMSPSDILQGVSQFSWPGRFQLVVQNNLQWFLDSAHNEMSVDKAAEWFTKTVNAQSIPTPTVRILIFSQITNERDDVAVFKCLVASLQGSNVQYVIFTTYNQGDGTDRVINRPLKASELPSQGAFSKLWKEAYPDAHIIIQPTIKSALDNAREIAKGYASMQALITGSQHLVGGALQLIYNS
ncbi:putative tetrahydrofolylpolyglutamate synthase [Xylogone sp. PMI_703]|nr:putative tetrahydrofolylpolyglutamate synthase [Xylogone sp. PMI_703]